MSYLQASKLSRPLLVHPLLACTVWDPSESGGHPRGPVRLIMQNHILLVDSCDQLQSES